MTLWTPNKKTSNSLGPVSYGTSRCKNDTINPISKPRLTPLHGGHSRKTSKPLQSSLHDDLRHSTVSVQNSILPKFSESTVSTKGSTLPRSSESNVFEITNNPAIMLLPHVLVESTVSDIPLSLLVDSGSSVSLLKITCIERLPKLNKEKNQLKGIDSSEEPIQTRGHFQLKLRLPKSSISHQFHVIDKIHLPYDGIIGSDMLNAHSCNIDITNNALHIGKSSLKLHFTIQLST
ncbi:unnamed protein product [Leptosia nina]|uniref:Retropepsins domain-containing protein n=1 Tax=Leptosia nina TaxID=320188 RepID=A0AAV1J2M0_9NEOP